MVLQLEDCIDCLKTIHPNYSMVYLFDHSSGHAKKRVGGLDACAMNKYFGGNQPLMHRKFIPTSIGYLGPFHQTSNSRMVQIGSYQSLVFPPVEHHSQNDYGPWWMSSQERKDRRFDITHESNQQKNRNQNHI